MKWFLTCFALLGLFAGSYGNVLAADPCDMLVSMHIQEHSGHDHDPEKPCDPSHDRNCPLEHHQHGSCCHTMPLAAEELASSRIGGNVFSLTPVCTESQSPPDGPFAELNKPPLI
jgi:hypothetical protein